MNFRNLMSGMAVATLLFTASAQPSLAAMTAEQRLTDFNQLVNIFERNYGPLRWKQTTIGLDWKKNAEEFRQKALASKSDAEFYRVLAQFLASLKDAHVSSQIPSTYRASLGFLCDVVEGKVLIETINTLRLPDVLFPFKKGDQLIALGGVPVEKIMADLTKVDHTGNEMSTKRIAAARLTSRRESSGLVIPKGVTTVTVLPKGADQPVTVTATWIVSGTPVLELDDLGSIGATNAIQNADDILELNKELKKLSLFNLRMPNAKLDEWSKAGVGDIGNPKSMFNLPEGFKQIDGLPITAGTYEVAGKKLGLIRVPGYMDDALLQYIAMAVMQMQDTDSLILDQTNNPGGSVSLVSDIISIFADKSYQDMNFEIRPSLGWLEVFQGINAQIAEMIAADPKDMAGNALKARFDYLEAEMRESLAQRRFLTNPVSLNLVGTFGMIQPQPTVRYKKPILMLINEFDFSGGDAFPALMKDNGRVTLFGAQTSGAGGNVAQHGPLANSHFKFYLTESLMVRPNGEYMENRGIQPDIAYSITEDDFMNGYRNYVKAFTIEALKLAGVAQADAEAALNK
jgi:hypothetical protein